jgi:transcriptional regulator with XRE-family HTH domain
MLPGARLRAFRVSGGLSQEALAEKLQSLGCSCTQTYVGLVERGKRGVGLSFAQAVETLTKGWGEGPIRTEEWLPRAAPVRRKKAS